MKIKESKQLKIGDSFKFDLEIWSASSNLIKKNTRLVVVGVYPHHVLCRDADIPHNKFDITNAALFQKGIYKKSDLECVAYAR